MKVFDGNQFLKSRECTINLSNGSQYIVKDLTDSAMDAITKIDETTTMEGVRDVVAKAFGTTSDALKGIGVVELQGSLDFLSKSLFDQK